MVQRSALVLGASGLIGSEVLKVCLNSDHYNRVIAPVRTTLGMDHGKLTEMAIDFNMPPWEDLFPVDHIYCCLGTTIKKAGSQGNFKKVDHDYPLAFAGAAKKWNTSVFSIVTAAGSNVRSKIFYNKVKGELEDKLKSLYLNTTLVFQPSLLLGEREEFRLGEKIGAGIAKLTGWMTPLSFRAISGQRVAQTMVKETLADRTGFHIILNKTMHAIG
tara:strand:+ start:140 stop:787 length:648 start_codon:yes stop_codon:yes gene_type:complete